MLRDIHYHVDYNYPAKEAVERFLDYKEKFGIEHITIQSIPISHSSGLTRLQNLKILMVKDMLYPYAFTGMGLYHGKDRKDYVTQLNEALNQGFESVKMLEGKPDCRKDLGKPICDNSFDPFYSAVEEKGLFLLMHLNDPLVNWDREKIDKWALEHGRCYDAEGFCSSEELYAEAAEILRKHPNLKIAFAHFGFYEDNLESAAKLFDKYPNVFLDLTPGMHYESFSANKDNARTFFIKYADRLLFGTDVSDAPLKPQSTYRDYLYGMTVGMLTGDEIPPFRGNSYNSLELPKDVCEKILFKNHKKIYGDVPKPVNKAAVLKELAEIEKSYDTLNEQDKIAFKEVKEYFM